MSSSSASTSRRSPRASSSCSIRAGNSNLRNPILASFVAKGVLLYGGLGSGVPRALEAWPDIDFRDDRDGGLFVATVRRKAVPANLRGTPTAQVTAQVTEHVVTLVKLLDGELARTEVLDAAVTTAIAEVVCVPERAARLARRRGWSLDTVLQAWRSLVTCDPEIGRAYALHLVDRIEVHGERILVTPKAGGRKGSRANDAAATEH